MPWPIGTLPIVEPDHWSSGSTSPALSPGKSIPVGWPKPKRSIHFASRAAPSFSASVIAPTFDERCEDLRDGHRLGAARLGVVDDPVGDVDRVRQRERRVRRDEPLREHAGDGHELERRARLVRVGDGAVPLQRERHAGSSGSRRSPAPAPSRAPRRSSGRARPRPRPSRATSRPSARSTCSAFAWIVWSSVVNTSRPSTSGVELTTSSARPNGSRTIVWLPGLPESFLSYADLEPLEPLVVDARVADHLRARRSSAGTSAAPPE